MRYLRLYLYFLRFSFSRAMEFRLDFFFRIGMDGLWYAQQFGLFYVLYEHTPLLGGWSMDQALIFVASMALIDSLHMTIFANNLWFLPMLINKGDLDYFLCRPVSSLFFVSVRDFAANSFVNLLIAISIFVWALGRYPEPLATTEILGLIAALGVGLFINYALHVCFTIPVFWLHSAEGPRQVYFSMHEMMHKPHGIFRGWVRRTLLSVLPFALIISYPVSLLFDGFSGRAVLHLLGVAAALGVFLLWFWRRGVRAYSSASS